MIGLGLNINQLVGRSVGPGLSVLQQAFNAAWDMQEDSGDALPDNGEVSLTAVNSPGTVSGPASGLSARSLVATSDHRFTSGSEILKNFSGKTYCIAYKRTSTTTNRALLGAASNITAASAGDGFIVRLLNTSGAIRLDVSARNAADSDRVIVTFEGAGMDSTDGEWVLLEIYFDPKGIVRARVFCPSQDVDLFQSGAGAGFNASPGPDFVIGNHSPPAANRAIDADVALFHIADRELLSWERSVYRQEFRRWADLPNAPAPTFPASPGVIDFPAEFEGYDIDVEVIRSGPRQYTASKSAEDFMPITTSTIYVDGADGDDANDGGTPETAKATIGAAWSSGSGVPRIVIASGNYAFPELVEKSAVFEADGAVTITGSRTLSKSAEGLLSLGFKGLRFTGQLESRQNIKAIFDSPALENSTINGVLRFDSNARGIIYGASGSNNDRDVISWNGESQGLEVDCSVKNNGTSGGDNASTGHGTCQVITVNPDYKDAWRTIADINSTRRLVFGGNVNGSRATNTFDSRNVSATSADGADSLGIWLYGVDCYGGAASELITDGTGGFIRYDDETIFEFQEGAVSDFERDLKS